MTSSNTVDITKIVRTGRVQSWLDDPTSRLPVSCTVFVVEDSMEGPDGIEDSWHFVSHALRNGAGCAVHLSKLRPAGQENEKGLVASGPVSFAKIYSVLNETLRRGGIYKNGAVVCHLDIDHPDILAFVNADRESLPWVKRCVDLTQDLWDAADQEVREGIIEGIKRGDIWLNKIRYEEDGERIYGNVCLEVYLRHRGTCLLEHVNLGACSVDDLTYVFDSGIKELCGLHPKTGVDESGYYLSPSGDKQVGLGVLGLANFLRKEGVTYSQLGDAFDYYFTYVLNLSTRFVEVDPGEAYDFGKDNKALAIVESLHLGIEQAAATARAHGMVRAFAIAPTATCSYRSKDVDGFTSTPEIAPPVARSVDRDSGTFGVETYHYGEVEIASEVGWKDYYRVVNGFVRLFEETGLFHGYSFNTWSDQVTYDEAFIEEWLTSPQSSMYYSLPVTSDSQDKSNAMSALGSEAQNLLTELFAPIGTEEEEAERRNVETKKEKRTIECIGCSE